mgnify:CR=1 FL=1
MPINPDAVGTESEPFEASWNSKDALLYAVGIGAGQQNRVDAARIACTRAGVRAQGAVAASDAFFPFPAGAGILSACNR